jgi:beta-N-acetylhexosaminidase
MFMYSFRGSLPPPEFVAAVRSGEAAAFCLFNYNAGTPEAVRALTEPLYAAARAGRLPPPILGMDQEGGQLMAVTGGATELPGNMALGATRSARLAYEAGRVLGRELLAMGVNMNYAPSLDVNNNPANPVIGIRSFGESPALVAELGIAVMRGIESEGVTATLKHFPGHGDVQGDTHHVAPVVKHPRAYLENVEFYPFREAIDAGARAVMSSHLIFEAVDTDNPATLSPAVMTGLLRSDMGFSGLTLTDAMDMYAVARFGTAGIRQALDAGNDLVLLGHIPDQLALTRAMGYTPPPERAARVLDARRRILYELPPLAVVGCDEHRQVAQAIADAAVTRVRGTLPLDVPADGRIVVITPRPVDLTPADTSSQVRIGLADAIRARHENTDWFELEPAADDAALGALLAQADGAARVIVGTIAADNDPRQAELVRQLIARGHDLVVIAMRTPYDLAAFPMVTTYLCIYGIRQPNTEAAARALFGEIEARGVLPCRIPGIAGERV